MRYHYRTLFRSRVYFRIRCCLHLPGGCKNIDIAVRGVSEFQPVLVLMMHVVALLLDWAMTIRTTSL